MTPIEKGRFLALASPVFWSLSGITVRLMDETTTPWQINFYRSSTLALFVIVILVIRYRQQVLRVIRTAGIVGVIAGIFVGCSMLCNIVALKHTSVANATILMASGPLFAALLGRFALTERVTTKSWVAICMAFIGIVLMVGDQEGASTLYGNLIALVGVGFFGAYAVTLRRRSDSDMTPAVLVAGIFSAAVSAIAATGTGTGLQASARTICFCIFLGIFQLGIGSVLFAIASRTVPAAELTLFSLSEPVLAPIWSWLGVGEIPSGRAIIGGGIIITALITQAWSPQKAPVTPP